MVESSAPIDRGWAWVIVAASFMNLLIIIGISKCFGILFAELLEFYHGSALATSTILALSAGLSLFSAPLVTSVSDLCTCRIVSMIGGVICSLGFLVPAFCSTLVQIIISFGILTGLGYGICLTPSAIIVGRYFEKHRSLANGILFCGSGVGSVIMPPILTYLIHLFGLHGAFLILAGFALQTVVFSALYRPLEYWKCVESPTSTDVGNEQVRLNDIGASVDKVSVTENRASAMGRRRLSSTDIVRRTDNPYLRPHASVSRLADKAFVAGPSTPRGLDASTVTMYFSAMNVAPWLRVPDDDVAETPIYDDGTEAPDRVGDVQIPQKNNWRRIFRRPCLVKAADGSDLPLFDFRLLRNVPLVLFVICCMFVLASVCIGMIIPAHCQEIGMTKTDVALLLSVQGGADTAGRLLAGFLGDRPFLQSRRKTKAVAALCCLICTVSTGVSVFLTSFWSLIAYLVICSLAVGCFVPMIPVLLVDLVGVENLSRAWGLTAFVEGFSVTLSPLIIGILRDRTQSYVSGLLFIDVCFALATVCILLAVIVDSKPQCA